MIRLIPLLSLFPALRLRPTLRRWHRNATTRRDLRALDTHLLRDIGVTPAAAAREARRPFWHR
ncbi:DUF1127 domain-containing protein [Pararhodobacter zhoushanensis]|uniref:DUF1127 domain-containing protein n=1 Tax=Pararhodobacter zhoushanensis TaxID=2479545 RepID=A0ABT3GUA0_9RHOB|nr:DUF1127 domain-containing protein [Pararhodobacter zhoushanensis]MCW1931112.1 DUF1127 domain-containing protein [Pararhodobacter zhoushanensis]